MDFIDKIQDLAVRIPKQLDHIQTEEATKNALVMPFIGALGYNVFDPTEVTPELDADVGIKKGEKVDYAILHEGEPIILFECKAHKYDLDKAHASQLYRYFSVTEARFGVLTNGLIYRFFTDLEESNKMDSKPFFEFNLLDFKERHVQELKKFTKSAFDLDNILTTASELKYTRAIKRVMAEQMQEPSDDFVRFFASQVYSGRLTQPVREQFAVITKKALQQYINDRINQRLESALRQPICRLHFNTTQKYLGLIDADKNEDKVPQFPLSFQRKRPFPHEKPSISWRDPLATGLGQIRGAITRKCH